MTGRRQPNGVFTISEVGNPLAFLEWAMPSWMVRGLCAQTDPEAFYPEKGGSTREAKRICAGCPVAAECLDYALANDEAFGIWGGLSERERRKIKQTLQGQKPANGNTFKTHCVNGHPFTPENTYERPGGGRQCRTCQRVQVADYKHKQETAS